MKKNGDFSLSTLCALAWFGHACGASMATGRLAVQYCSRHGAVGLLGAVTVWVVSVAFAWIIMEYGRLVRANNYHDVVSTIYWPNKLLGKSMNVVWDLITLFSVIVVSGTCVAGTGALLENVFGLNYNIGMILFVGLMLALFLAGPGVLKTLGKISLPMLILLLILCVVSILMGWENLVDVLAGKLNSHIPAGAGTAGSAIKDGVIYGMTQSGFVATGVVYSSQFTSRRETNRTCLLALLMGGTAMVACTLAALAWFPEINSETLPYLTIVQKLSGPPGTVFRAVYYIVLIIAYVSTAGSLLTGGVARYKLLLGKWVKREKLCIGILVVFFLSASTIIGTLGLTAIVDKGYKFLGTLRSYTWFYPLLVLGPIAIHRVNKMLRQTGKLEFYPPEPVASDSTPPR